MAMRLIPAPIRASLAMLAALAAFTGPAWAQGASTPVAPSPVAGSGDALAAQASASVLRIVSFANPDGVAPQRVETARLPSLPVERLRFPLPVELRTAFQAEACRLNGLEWCPIFREETRGTAFAADRPGRFMTCRHIVQDWLHWARAYNPGRLATQEIIPPFTLSRADGRLVFISIAQDAGYRTSLMAESRRLDRPLKTLLRGDLFWDADFLQFDLADGLDAPPLRRREALQAGESFLLLGYPDKAGASNGQPLSLARGEVLRREGVTLVTNAPSAKGISGGPMIDARGMVGGMACSIGRAHGPRAYRPALGLPVLPGELGALLRDLHGVETSGTP